MKKLFLLILVMLPGVASAVEIKTFQQIPFISGDLSTEAYINALYNGAIALGAMAAVIMIIWAGTEYMLSDLVTSKSAAKDRIKNALLGLLIILVAATLLETINPTLLNLNVIGKGEPVHIEGGSGGDADELFFRPGEEFTRDRAIELECGSLWFGWGGDECAEAFQAKLLKSCKENHGTTLQFEDNKYKCI